MMKLIRRIKDDKGASNTISFMVIMFFVMIMIISFIDVGLYFNTKNQMQAAAENGARSVAMYGGVSNKVRDVRGGSIDPIELTWQSIPSNFRTIKPGKNVVYVTKSKITCHPQTGKIKAGDPVWCEVGYKWNGIAGAFNLFKLGVYGTSAPDTVVRGTSVSEVTIE